MVKQRIEPRWGDPHEAADEPERFIVQPRPRESAGADDDQPVRLHVFRRLAWAVALLGSGALAVKGIGWYAEQSDSPALQDWVERVEQTFSGARERMLRIPARQLPRTSNEGRELREQCDALGRAFVANPQPEIREQMLLACQAYEQYRLSGQAAGERRSASD